MRTASNHVLKVVETQKRSFRLATEVYKRRKTSLKFKVWLVEHSCESCLKTLVIDLFSSISLISAITSKNNNNDKKKKKKARNVLCLYREMFRESIKKTKHVFLEYIAIIYILMLIDGQVIIVPPPIPSHPVHHLLRKS